MRNYRLSAASPIRIFFGIELGEGLRLSPETEPLAAPFDGLTDALDAAYTARIAAKKPMVRARARRRLAAHTLRQSIRSAARAAEIADGGRRGPIFGAVFPHGTRAQVSNGPRKLATITAALVDRLNKSKVAGITAFKAEWSAKLTATLDAFNQATATFDARRSVYKDAFSTEVALRDQHRVEVDRIMGQVRTAFPGDADRQDLVFPPPEPAEVEQEDDDDASPAEPEATKPPAPPSMPPPSLEPVAYPAPVSVAP